MGIDVLQAIRNKRQMGLKVCEEWEAVGSNTDYGGAVAGGVLGSVQ